MSDNPYRPPEPEPVWPDRLRNHDWPRRTYRPPEPVAYTVDPDTTLREAQEVGRVLIEAQDLTMTNLSLDKDTLSMAISECVFRLFGFGPSKSITDPYAEAVIAEAQRVGFKLERP
jgi:hypothetical protein